MTDFGRDEQSGRSMVEMLGVLAIIGVLSIGGIAGYSKAMTKFKVSKSMDQVSTIVANVRTMYAQQRNYSGLTMERAISFGFMPAEMRASDSDLTNSFAGTVLLNEAQYNGTAGAAFTLVYNGLGQEACITMAIADWGSGSSSGLVGMKVEGVEQAVTEMGDAAYTGTDLPVSMAEALNKCQCVLPTCSVAWYYQ